MIRSSKFGKKSSPASEMAKAKKKSGPRNPLKDLNSINSSSSSSLSVDSPRGCLSFFLSNSSSRTPVHIPKTPKSAPNPRTSKPRSNAPKKNHTKTILENPENTSSQMSQKAKKNLPCLYQWPTGKRFTSRAPHQPKPSQILENNSNPGKKLASGSEEIIQNQKHSKQQQWSTGMIDDTGEPPEPRSTSFKADFDENVTPLNHRVSGSGLDSTPGKAMEENSSTTTTTPPVQASISPEIQCGSSVVSTPACFGAGHVISGVTDKRKCRPRGILTVGENDLGKARVFDNDDDNVLGFLNNSRVSLVPSPTEASMHWLLSPCEEDENQKKSNAGNGSPEFRRLEGPTILHSPSSPSSSHGMSSDVWNISSNSKSTTSRSSTPPSRRDPLVSANGVPEFQGFVASTSSMFQIRAASDHGAGCSSLYGTEKSSCKAFMSPEERKYRYDLLEENSPFSCDSLGSWNVISTPQSESSPDRHVGLSFLNANDHQEDRDEIDSMAEVLRTTCLSPQSQISMWDPVDIQPLPGLSFEFAHPIKPSNSIDLIQIETSFKNWGLESYSSAFENVSRSNMRISWREGLVSRIFEMDDLDCCRCLSDEDENAHGCSKDRSVSNFGRETDDNKGNDQTLTDVLGCPEFGFEEPTIDAKSKVSFPPQGPSSCAESISTEGGGLIASGDSDWTVCYKNQLFQV